MKNIVHIIDDSIEISAQKYLKIDKTLISKYKLEYPALSHVRMNESTLGEFLLNGKDLIGYYNLDVKDNITWIQAFEIFDKYKNKGLSHKLLIRAIDKGATHLTVNIKNVRAIELYKKHGFIEYDRSKVQIYMKLK